MVRVQPDDVAATGVTKVMLHLPVNSRITFILYAVVARLDLHSFPTRRSSDLGPNGAGKSTFFNILAGQLRADGGAVDLRSEEHTSELQSRQYLVCRLLREKKKKYSSRYAELPCCVQNSVVRFIEPFAGNVSPC